jgi:hypothetical protein
MRHWGDAKVSLHLGYRPFYVIISSEPAPAGAMPLTDAGRITHSCRVWQRRLRVSLRDWPTWLELVPVNQNSLNAALSEADGEEAMFSAGGGEASRRGPPEGTAGSVLYAGAAEVPRRVTSARN